MLFTILAGRDTEQLAELTREVVAVAEADLEGDLGNAVLGAAQERRGTVHAYLDEVGDRRAAHRRLKASHETPLRHVGDFRQAVEVDGLLIICLQMADGFADAKQGARVRVLRLGKAARQITNKLHERGGGHKLESAG